MSEPTAPLFRLAHAAHGRLRVRIDLPPGSGNLHDLAGELAAIPEILRVSANHRARSVTIHYDPAAAATPSLVQHLCTLGLDTFGSRHAPGVTGFLVEALGPRFRDHRTLSGRLNRKLWASSSGQVDLFRVLAWLLVLAVGVDAGVAVARGVAIPWGRLFSYLLAATAIRTASDVPFLTDR
jgi:hypothetical protein